MVAKEGKRVGIYLKPRLLAQTDALAQRLHLSRSAVISMALAKLIEQENPGTGIEKSLQTTRKRK